MNIIIIYKSGRKRNIRGCNFLEVNPNLQRGIYYEKSGEDKHYCYDDVLVDKVERIEIIM